MRQHRSEIILKKNSFLINKMVGTQKWLFHKNKPFINDIVMSE